MSDPALFLISIYGILNAILWGVVLTRIGRIDREAKAARWYASQNARTEGIRKSRGVSTRSIAE